jgi:tetratricopeptide (TPR) repeat protein
MILMHRAFPINQTFYGTRSGRTALAAVLLVLAASCSPRLTGRAAVDLNPVEVLEKSPRIYHLRFEDFADSLETRMAASYFQGGLEAEFDSVRIDTAGMEVVSDKDRAVREYSEAVRRFRNGAGRESLLHTRKALELAPGYGPPYVLLGNLLLAQGRVSEALGLFRRIVSSDATDSDALVGLARCYMFKGKIDSAKQALVDAVIYDRVNMEAWKNLHVLGSVQRFTVADHDVIQLARVRRTRGRHYDLVVDRSLENCPSAATAWVVFASERAVWQYEGKFKYTLGLTRYRPTYQEDIDCFMALAAAWKIISADDSTGYECMEQPLAARNFPSEVIERMRSYLNGYVLVRGG